MKDGILHLQLPIVYLIWGLLRHCWMLRRRLEAAVDCWRGPQYDGKCSFYFKCYFFRVTPTNRDLREKAVYFHLSQWPQGLAIRLQGSAIMPQKWSYTKLSPEWTGVTLFLEDNFQRVRVSQNWFIFYSLFSLLYGWQKNCHKEKHFLERWSSHFVYNFFL